MRIMRLASVALFAVLAFSAMAAASASAFHPLFFTQSGKELLFSGRGVDPILRGEALNKVSVSILCNELLIHGFALNLSTLAHRVLVTLENECVQRLKGGPTPELCKEPIVTKRLLAELGLQTATNKLADILLAPSDGTNVFGEVECGGFKTTVKGVIVGEIPSSQLNALRNTFEVVYEPFPALSTKQAITEIYLLGTQMFEQELTASGFGTGPVSLEVDVKLTSDGLAEVSTTKE